VANARKVLENAALEHMALSTQQLMIDPSRYSGTWLQAPEHWRAYDDAMRESMRRSAAAPSRAEHRQIMRDLVGETADCVPFPASIVSGNTDSRYRLMPAVLDLAPHAFELAKLVDKLSWVVRLLLSKGAGSGTMAADLLASRGASVVTYQTARHYANAELFHGDKRYEELRDLSFAAAVLEGGNCSENAAVLLGLAQSLDDAMLADMGVNVDPSKLLFLWARDSACDHVYALVHHEDDGSADARDPSQYSKLWAIDPHQPYPMASRYDQTLYNHPHVDRVVGMPGPRFAHPVYQAKDLRLDLGAVRAVQARLQASLGNRWMDRTERAPVAQELSHYPQLAALMREQGVADYAQLDTSQLEPTRRAMLETQIAALDRMVMLRAFSRQVERDALPAYARWQSICAAVNPRAVYRNSATGEILAPTVPVHYLERTERARWAWHVYRFPPLNLPWDSTQIVPPAVQAIEEEPFLGALAAARAMDLSANHLHPEGVRDFHRALSALEQWIDRLHSESSPALLSRVHATGLQGQVIKGLKTVEQNLHTLRRIARRLEARAEPASVHQEQAVDLGLRIAHSKARPQIAQLLARLA
jgi:hypothetical protein